MKFDIKIADILTLPITIMAAISLASSIVIFSPIEFIDKIFMLEFRNKNGFWMGIVFLISTSIITVNLVYKTLVILFGMRKKRIFIKNAKKKLWNLSTYQKSIVYELYKQDNYTYELPIYDGAVISLSQNLIIGRVAGQYLISNLNDARIPHTLQPWVIEELQEVRLNENFKSAHNEFIGK